MKVVKAVLAGVLLALTAPLFGQIAISALPPASTPLTGTEAVPLVQSGTTKKVTVSNLSPGLGSQSANKIYASPNGGSGPASFRQGVTNDVNYTTTGTGAVTETQTVTNARVPYPDQWGADPNGVADSSAAIANAFANTTGALHLKGNYRLASTLTIPSGRSLWGDSVVGGNPANNGTRLVCDLGVTPCVIMGSGSQNKPVGLHNVNVNRAAGTPDIASIGIEVLDGYNVVLDNVGSQSHGICLKLLSHPSIGAGLGLQATNVFTGACLDAHVDINSWPEARFSHSRFGMNGSGDYNSDTYVRIEGGVASTAGGPNTISFVNNQFNQGTNTAAHFFEFVNLGSGGVPSIDATAFTIADNFIDGVGTSVFYSDSSWNVIDRLIVAHNIFLSTGVPTFALNVGTEPSEWALTGNLFYGSTFNLAPTAQISAVNVIGNRIFGTTSLTAASGSTAAFANNNHGGNETIAGTWGEFTSTGESFTSGAISITGTGPINVFDPGVHIFGGEASGVPVVSSCGTSPVIDGNSTDNSGVVTIGSGGVTACTVTYAHAFPNDAMPVVTAGTTGTPAIYISSADKSHFIVNFASDASSKSFYYGVTGQ